MVQSCVQTFRVAYNYGKFMLWKMRCFTLQSMSRTNHIQWIALPLAATELRDGKFMVCF